MLESEQGWLGIALSSKDLTSQFKSRQLHKCIKEVAGTVYILQIFVARMKGISLTWFVQTPYPNYNEIESETKIPSVDSVLLINQCL